MRTDERPRRPTRVAYLTALVAPLGLTIAASAPVQAETCVVKRGSATGLTRDFAEYEAFLIIRQVTGNWPIATDRFSNPVYKCTNDGVLWTCHANAKVCRG